MAQNVKITLDTKFIKRDWDKIIESPLKKSGLLVRKIMRGSIRRKPSHSQKTGKRLKPSKPGRPPLSRHPEGWMKRIYSVPQPEQSKAIIGAVKMPGGPNPPVPAVHEFGLRTNEKKRKWRGTGKNRKRRPVRVSIDMPARPFAWPALKKAHESGGVMKKFEGCINSKTTKPKPKKVT